MLCIFCEKRRTIRGHLVSKEWISSLVPPGSELVHELKKLATDAPADRPVDARWRHKKFDLAVNCTCAKCDNGWIDRLDTKVQPFLTEMNSAASLSLRVTEQVAIAGWVARVAAMTNAQDARRPSFSRADLERIRQEQLPPERAAVWVAGVKNPPADTPSSFHRAYLEPSMVITGGDLGAVGQGKVLSHGPDDPHIYLVTFRIRHLAFQIFMPNEPPDLFPPRAAGFDSPLKQIWPIQLAALSWPPGSALANGEAFRSLTESFGAASETREGYFSL